MLQRPCHSFVFLITLLLFQVIYFGSSFYVCEASTVSATRTSVDLNQRWQEVQRRLMPGAHTDSDLKIVKEKNHGFAEDQITEEPIGLAGYRRDYAGVNDTLLPQHELKYGFGQSFTFQRFQSPISIRKALRFVRSTSSFKWFEGKNGRKGYISSTKLGGDYVLAESEQIAIDCRTDDVLRAYLSGKLQSRWNAKDCLECNIMKFKKKNDPSHVSYIREHATKSPRLNLWSFRPNDSTDRRVEIQQHKSNYEDDGDRKDRYFYLQDLLLKSQRVIRSHTGPMRYQQIIEIDKVGQHNYSILVSLFKNKNESYRQNNNRSEEQQDLNYAFTTTAKKPFESLEVYVGLEQMGSDVKIYAAGVFEVNRKVVPKIIIFDTSGFAGSLAGKGTLWLAGYFENASMKRKLQKMK